MRWIVEKVVHDPEKPPAPKPELPEELFETLRGRFRDDVAADPGVRRPRVPRLARLQLGSAVRIAVAADERVGVAESLADELERARP